MGYRITTKHPLTALVSALRAVAHLHQSHHWQVRGSSFWGDHKLLDEVYQTAHDDIDRLAERSVGRSGPDTVEVAELMAGARRYLAEMDTRPYTADNEGMMRLSLAAERALLDVIEQAKQILQGQGKLTGGTSNLLDGIADRHEQSVYFLQQRVT